MTPDALLALFARPPTPIARRWCRCVGEAAACPHRPPRPVRARRRRRRGRDRRCCTPRRVAVVSEESGWSGDRGADDHRRRRSGRRVHELRARDPVLGHLAVRARRRRSAVLARHEHAAGRVRHRRPRARRRARRAPRCARRRPSGSRTRWSRCRGCRCGSLPWKQFRALGSAALVALRRGVGPSRRHGRRVARPARSVGLPRWAAGVYRGRRRRPRRARARPSQWSTPTLAASSSPARRRSWSTRCSPRCASRATLDLDALLGVAQRTRRAPAARSCRRVRRGAPTHWPRRPATG